MSIDDLPCLIRALAAIPWRWEPGCWESLKGALGLSRLEHARNQRDTVRSYPLCNSVVRAHLASWQEQELIDVSCMLETSGYLGELSENGEIADFSELSEARYEATEAEYEILFERAGQLVRDVLGAPEYVGNGQSEDYPDELCADCAMVWTIKNAHLSLQKYTEDDHLGIDILIKIQPLIPDLLP